MKRIVAVDVLRGFALLGILIMNIMSYAMPDIAYYNPAAFGGEEWFNRLTYTIVHIFADQKFMALFSMLFGASMILLINNLERKGQRVARFHYTRNLWLLLIGFLQAILIWDGDILVVYALCAFALYFLRNLAPRWQFTLGLVIFLSPVFGYLAGSALTTGLSPDEMVVLETYWQPSDAEIATEIEFYRGNYLPQVFDRLKGESRSSPALDVYFIVLIFEFFTRAFGMMLIGMAFYAWDIVTGQKSDRFYKQLLMVGLPAGVGLAAFGVWWNSSAEWDVLQAIFIGRLPNLLATPLLAGAYIALVMLFIRSNIWQSLQQKLAATGRMALTNYIGQSLIGTFIFYGFGLGLFGSLDRVSLLPFIILIWVLQLWLSPIWLRYFRYGPLEWLWRTLSYGKVQPWRRSSQPL
jgi:uncharacterized protein